MVQYTKVGTDTTQTTPVSGKLFAMFPDKEHCDYSDLESTIIGAIQAGDIPDLSGTYATVSHAHATTDITSGTFADARIAETNVTQHQGALSITESQISDYDPASTDTARIAGSTYSTVQHIQDLFHSSGWTSGGAITDNGDGSIAVAAGTGLIRATNSNVATIYFTDFSAVNPLSLTDNDNNYIYVEYNAGSPQVIATTAERTDYNTNFLIGQVYRSGTTLHINQNVKSAVSDHAGLMIRFNQEVMPYAHVSGATLSETGTRSIAFTAGAFWHGLVKFTTDAFDSSTADTFTYFYQDGLGGWTIVASQSQIDNANYDDGSGTLASLTANRYGVHWVYLTGEDTTEVYVIYGQGNYTLTQAQDASPPATVPELISTQGFLAGKIIIQDGASSFSQIESAFMSMFSPSIVTEHNTLSGLQGGTTAEYYHLTSAEYAIMQATTASFTTADETKLDGIEASADVTDATNVAAAGAVMGTDTLTSCLTGSIQTVADQDYTILLKAPHAMTITETTTKSGAGTCTATFKINTTALGGTANSVSTSEQSQAHASSNSVSAGDDIVMTISSNSSCTDMNFTIKYTATLSDMVS